MRRTKKTSSPPKPVRPVQLALRRTWLIWLFYRILAYPLVVGISAGASVTSGVLWQFLMLIPALLLTRTIHKSNSPYGLIVASMISLVYLAVAGVYLFVRIYEHAPVLICLGFLFETVLLFVINVQLFILLKRLPPMHKNLPPQK